MITVENRLVYYEALDQWMVHGNTAPFINLVNVIVLKKFKHYQMVLEI
ncbi:hypothetical protein J5N55_14660 [Acinetobacter haemolyticus]|uniref:Uncharacterized protein n=1 Tax=Acinetobacter haemolyticus TaxID=29430 RepID=A0AAW4J8L8_ACIHA|nr:hypothetical protein [Acinetobacter haemolyticus]